jgi:hypothetical protein
MPTEFRYETVFRAASPKVVAASYFDPDHLATQDVVAELVDRKVVESRDDGATLHTVWRVAHAKPLPLYARPFVSGGRLRYLETMTWRREADEVDMIVQPEILGGRVKIEATYTLKQVGEGQVHRRYAGTITVDVRLISGKAEKAILAKFEESMPTMAACTQGWLDKTASRPPG